MLTNVFGLTFSVNGINYKTTSDSTVEVAYSAATTTGNVVIQGIITFTNTTYKVTSIGAQVFWGCTGLASVYIPSSITTIGSLAFFGCSNLTALNVDTMNTHYRSINGVLFNREKTSLIYYPGGKIGSYSIPASVSSIETYAFYGCSGLTAITIPSSVTSVGDVAFGSCSGLSSITVDKANPNYISSNGVLFDIGENNLICYPIGKTGSYSIPTSVRVIGNSAFENCKGLTSITIPSTITDLGTYALGDCTNLENIKIYATTPPATAKSLTGLTKTIPLYVPEESVDVYKNTFEWEDFTNITGMTTGTENPQESNYSINISNRKVQLSGIVGKSISVYDISGKKIFEKSNTKNNEEFSVDKQGLYIISINNDKRKIIIY